MTKISTQEAAKMLGLPIGAIRGGVIQGSLPIGFAVKRKRWSFYIMKEWVEAYIRGERLMPEKEDDVD